MKSKGKLILVVSLLLVITAFIILYILINEHSKQELSYVYKKSMHNSFHIEQDIVVIDDNIVVKNNTNRDLYFNMYADVKKDRGLVIEDFAPACEKDSLEKEKFFIKAKSEASFVAHFKAKKGDKTTKQDRRAPKDVKFEIVK
jgi:hypothetical protein